MKTFLLVCMLFIGYTSLDAAQNEQERIPDVYPKKIVFGTYSNKNSAKNVFYNFRKDKVYKELYDMAVKNNFMIHYRPLANYTILVMEPIQKRVVFLKALRLVKQKYPRAYHLSAEGLDIPITKSLPPLVQKAPTEIDSIKTDTASEQELPLASKGSSKVEEPMFNVEEVTDSKMSVVSKSGSKQESAKAAEVKKDEPETKLKEQSKSSLDANMTEEPLENNKVSEENSEDVKAAQSEKEQKAEPETAAKKVKSFLQSIVNYFSHSEQKSEEPKVKKETKTVKAAKEKVAVPALKDDTENALVESEVPELAVSEEEKELKEDVEADKSISAVNTKQDESTSVEEDALDFSQSKNESKFEDDNIAKSSDIADKVEPEMQMKKPELEKEKPEASQKVEVKPANPFSQLKEKPKPESSYFTFSNIILGLLLIFSPLLYRKFKKLKSVYDKY